MCGYIIYKKNKKKHIKWLYPKAITQMLTKLMLNL